MVSVACRVLVGERFVPVLLILLAFFSKPKSRASVYPGATESDETLFELFSGGDERAFEVLLDRHGDEVFGYLTRFFGDRELAADLTQDVFLKVIASAGAFRGESSFRTFLFRVVRNLCIDVMRSRSARPDSRASSLDSRGPGGEGPSLEERVAGTSPEGSARTFSHELSGALEAGLRRLPDEQREVFLMREVECLKFREIAVILAINENTVKSRMNYAIKSLRESLDAFAER